jgi:hypothetical protein
MNKTPLGTMADRAVKVAEIIGTAIDDQDAVRIGVIAEAIRLFYAKQWPAPWPPWPLNSNEKEIARNLGRALTALEDKFAEFEKRPVRERVVLERAVYGAEAEFFEWRAQLTRWRGALETFGGKATADSSTLFPDELFPNGKPKPSWPLGKKRSSKRISKADFKHDAAVAAAAILDAHGIEPTATQKSDTQKLSIFCQVTAVLAGDDRIYHACRTLVEKRETR